MVVSSVAPSAGPLPSDLDLYSFLFEQFPPARPDPRGTGIPLLIDADSGDSWSFEGIKERVDALAVGLREHLGLGMNDGMGVTVLSHNSVDLLTATWAAQKYGAVVSLADPGCSSASLSYQIDASQTSVFFVSDQPALRSTALSAADSINFPRSRIVLLQSPQTIRAQLVANFGQAAPRVNGLLTLAGLVEAGRAAIAGARDQPAEMDKGRRRLADGEPARKAAFLSFEEDSAGSSRALPIQHSAPIANVLQLAAFNGLPSKLIDPSEAASAKLKREGALPRFRPGADSCSAMAPFHNISNLVATVLFSFYAAVGVVVMPNCHLGTALQAMLLSRVSIASLTATQLVHLAKDSGVKKSEDPPMLRLVLLVSGTLISEKVAQMVRRVLPGVDVVQGYGTSTVAGLATMTPPAIASSSLFAGAGTLLSDTHAKIVNSGGKSCAINEPGELWLCGPQCTSSAAMHEGPSHDSFLRTGHQAIFDPENRLFILDAPHHLINIKGSLIAPRHLEDHLLVSPLVGDCGIVNVENDRIGSFPALFVVLTSAAREKARKGGEKEEKKIKTELVKWLAEGNVTYKQLKDAIRFIDAIPKCSSGKILRSALRALASATAVPPLGPSMGFFEPTERAAITSSKSTLIVPVAASTVAGTAGTTASGKKTPRDSRRRATHSQIERRRREKINDRLVTLRTIVPACSREVEDRRNARLAEEAEAARIAAGGAPRVAPGAAKGVDANGKGKRKRNRRKAESTKKQDGEEELGLHKLEVLTHTIDYIYELKARIEELETGRKPPVPVTKNGVDDDEDEDDDGAYEMSEWVSAAHGRKMVADPDAMDEDGEDGDEGGQTRSAKRAHTASSSLNPHLQARRHTMCPSSSSASASLSTSPMMSLTAESPMLSPYSTLTSPMMSLSAESPIMLSPFNPSPHHHHQKSSNSVPSPTGRGSGSGSISGSASGLGSAVSRSGKPGSNVTSPVWAPLPSSAIPLTNKVYAPPRRDSILLPPGTNVVERRPPNTPGFPAMGARTTLPSPSLEPEPQRLNNGRETILPCESIENGRSAGSSVAGAASSSASSSVGAAASASSSSAPGATATAPTATGAPDDASAAQLLLSFSTSPEVMRPQQSISAVRRTPMGMFATPQFRPTAAGSISSSSFGIGTGTGAGGAYGAGGPGAATSATRFGGRAMPGSAPGGALALSRTRPNELASPPLLALDAAASTVEGDADADAMPEVEMGGAGEDRDDASTPLAELPPPLKDVKEEQ